jgi:hypothetical protein
MPASAWRHAAYLLVPAVFWLVPNTTLQGYPFGID